MDILDERSGERRLLGRWLIVCALAVIALLLLWPRHQGHIVAVLPYAFLFLCPVVHLLMHRHHGGGHHNEAPRAK